MTERSEASVDPRLALARLSLEGLSLGDAFGERFFQPPAIADAWIRDREAPPGPWRFTDDTAMALAVMDVLQRRGGIVEDDLARAFAERYAEEPWRGYGGGAHRVLQEIIAGRPWRAASRSLFGGEGSLGNGAAMRVAPVGAFFADDPSLAAEAAKRSAVVTHAHPEGQAGAIAVAAAAAHAARGVSGEELLVAAIEATPESDVRAGLRAARALPLSYAPVTAASALGNGERVSAPDTVPYALWCAARHGHDFEAAMWATVETGGDRDTTCAIVGGIVAMTAPSLPESWLARREALPPGASLEP